jgi:membrane protein implicated in regulation of membrane protease activity
MMWETGALYIGLGLVLCIFELFLFSFFLLPLGLAAILVGLVALFITSSLGIHALVFALAAFCLLWLFRVLKRKWAAERQTKAENPFETLHVGAKGRKGIVIEAYASLEKPGRVKVFSDEWEVCAEDMDPNLLRELQVGDSVRVVAMHGNKVVVEK